MLDCWYGFAFKLDLIWFLTIDIGIMWKPLHTHTHETASSLEYPSKARNCSFNFRFYHVGIAKGALLGKFSIVLMTPNSFPFIFSLFLDNLKFVNDLCQQVMMMQFWMMPMKSRNFNREKIPTTKSQKSHFEFYLNFTNIFELLLF